VPRRTSPISAARSAARGGPLDAERAPIALGHRRVTKHRLGAAGDGLEDRARQQRVAGSVDPMSVSATRVDEHIAGVRDRGRLDRPPDELGPHVAQV
jgi:hypothetical protein